MIELLSRLSPATSSFLGQMQDDGREREADTDEESGEEEVEPKKVSTKKLNRCPTCRGKGQVKKPVAMLGVRPEYEMCPRCGGSKKRAESVATASRNKGAPALMSAEQIAFACKGIPRHYLNAAILLTTHDFRVREWLAEDIVEHAVPVLEPETWGVPPEVAAIRSLGLARVATMNVMLGQSKEVGERVACELMCCRHQAWQRSWRRRAGALTEISFGWIAECDRRMSANAHEAA